MQFLVRKYQNINRNYRNFVIADKRILFNNLNKQFHYYITKLYNILDEISLYHCINYEHKGLMRAVHTYQLDTTLIPRIWKRSFPLSSMTDILDIYIGNYDIGNYDIINIIMDYYIHMKIDIIRPGHYRRALTTWLMILRKVKNMLYTFHV